MGIKSTIQLLSAFVATGAGGNWIASYGGSYVLMVAGTFGGTSHKLQILGPDGVTYIDVPNTTFAAAGYVSVDIPAGATVRSFLTGGTGISLNATLGLCRQ